MGERLNKLDGERGFTLIELLVVILIIGILAAIALPLFLSQQEKAQDVNAKHNARDAVTDVEVCHSGTADYTKCDSAAELFDTSLPYGPAIGQVRVTGATQASYTVEARSHATDGGDHTFTITKSGGGAVRDCTPSGKGGCPDSGTW